MERNMAVMMKTKIGGSIHRIREFELEKVNLAEEFDILQIVGEGWFGKILLVEHRATDTEMVLKALPKAYTALRDFYKEFHYSLHLGAHKNVITTYDVAFETAGFYVFSQEYAPLGDLTSNVTESGIGELHTKRVARQLAAALQHVHGRGLVHRDVKLDNVLVLRSDFSRVKLCDFGETRRAGTPVRRRNEWLPYAPPEVLQTDNDDHYKAVTSHDVWQFGIVIFVCLTGCLPWQKAAADDPRFARYLSWQSSTMSPIRRQPKLFKLVSSKAQRLFKKFLEPRPEKRPVSLEELHRYLDDRWMAKGGQDKNSAVAGTEDDGLCPSMYSFHSSPEEKNKLLHTLTQYGIETTVDRGAKKDRIRAWIQSSVIEEGDENAEEKNNVEEGGSTDEEENISIIDNETGPAGERIENRGPISDRRLSENGQVKKPVENGVINNNTNSVQKPIAQVDSKPSIPPRKTHKKSKEERRQVKEKIYTTPIDPTIPLEKQRTGTIKKDKVKTNQIKEDEQNEKIPGYRDPNAFLKDTSTNTNLNTPEVNQPKPIENVPNQFQNQNTPITTNNVEVIKQNDYQIQYTSPRLTRKYEPTPVINQNTVPPVKMERKDKYAATKPPVPSVPIKLTQKSVHGAVMVSASIALGGAVNMQNHDNTDAQMKRDMHKLESEKEKDRNFNVYGIDERRSSKEVAYNQSKYSPRGNRKVTFNTPSASTSRSGSRS